jgi:hypothetical protein
MIETKVTGKIFIRRVENNDDIVFTRNLPIFIKEECSLDFDNTLTITLDAW